MAGMKQIQAAQVLLLRTASAEADKAAQDLRDLGMVHVAVVTSVLELAVRIAGGKVNVVVVYEQDTAAAVLRGEDGLVQAPPDARTASIPCLLLTPEAGRRTTQAAQAAGFAAALPDTAPARVIYRRVGALMQRVRRLGRERDAAQRAAA
ncbi:hypothetical protein [Phreatobacter sp. AB_2022a]|uniref:hypothetical protein n=1 Tax=Phreatobacter sp. AB_2022a TaxID=3003134 RepID=UPI00228718FB|nr:hypothetical protein [Phreatobacter sp. AB_2022a]MCZ0737040.1 hypothetical protein [Phreatobacter sp. AB_2022a]